MGNIKSNKVVKVMELDKLRSYMVSKKIIARYRLLLIDMEGDCPAVCWVPWQLSQVKSSGGQ